MGGFLDFATSAGGGSLLGGIATGLFGRSSAKQTNEQTEQLSSTAHQRATKDLRLAGLNPILSATGGMGSGASTPQLKDPGEAMVKGVGTGASSALQAKRLTQEIKNLEAQEWNTKAQQFKTNQESILLGYQMPEGKASADLWKNLMQEEGSSAKAIQMLRSLMKK